MSSERKSEPLKPSFEQFFASWGDELQAQLNRVEQLIGDVHRQSSGNYREVLLRDLFRRVLPPRFKVSTGFALGWPGRASTQMDVMIWDASEHPPFMEVGEFAIVSDEAVRALIEVKTTLGKDGLVSALGALHPAHYLSWGDQHRRPTSKLQPLEPRERRVPPVRGVLGFYSDWASPVENVLQILRAHYCEKFEQECSAWLGPSLGRFPNLVDVVGVEGTVVEQGRITALVGNEISGSAPGFCARRFEGAASAAWLVRFCFVVAEKIRELETGEMKVANEVLDRVPGKFPSPAAIALMPIQGTTYRWAKFGMDPTSTIELFTP